MNTPPLLARGAHVVLRLCVPLVLLFSSLYVFVTPGFVHHEYAQPGFPPSERFAPAERTRLSDTILNYLRGRTSREAMATMRTDGGEVAMRPEEVQHIADVKAVMDGFFVVHGVALGLALLCGVALWRSPARRTLPQDLRAGVLYGAAVIAFIVVASLVNFEVFFTRFHQLFFQDESWLFWETDTLIQLYPIPLWMDAVWKLGVFIAAELLIAYAAAWAWQRAWAERS
jgi:integral membrane protein (TIGR01906 family)